MGIWFGVPEAQRITADLACLLIAALLVTRLQRPLASVLTRSWKDKQSWGRGGIIVGQAVAVAVIVVLVILGIGIFLDLTQTLGLPQVPAG